MAMQQKNPFVMSVHQELFNQKIHIANSTTLYSKKMFLAKPNVLQKPLKKLF